MKKLFYNLLIVAFIFTFSVPQVFAVYVNGYYRSNGTYVNGYERTAPDGNPYNNYDYPGNYNPNTGSVTGGNPQTYLNEYYENTPDSSYSYPTTPTCPLNSYYDGVSSCKCNYGYYVSGGSCVSQDALCENQIGYGATYDSLDDTCKCGYGDVIGASGQCTNANLYCSSKIGIMSDYNSSTKQCECMSGYEFNGSSCEYKNTDYSVSPTPDPVSSQTIDSNQSMNQEMQTFCANLGGDMYKWDSTAGVCKCADGYSIGVSGKCASMGVVTPPPQPTTPTPSIVQTGCAVNQTMVNNSNGSWSCVCATGYQDNPNPDANPASFCVKTPVTKIIKKPFQATGFHSLVATTSDTTATSSSSTLPFLFGSGNKETSTPTTSWFTKVWKLFFGSN